MLYPMKLTVDSVFLAFDKISKESGDSFYIK